MSEPLKYDLTKSVGRYLDRHFLIVNVFEFLEENQIYPENDIKKMKLDLLSSTHMTDFAIDIFKEINGDDAAVPTEMSFQKERAHELNSELNDKLEHLLTIFENEELVQKLKEEKHFTLDYLKEHHGVTEEILTSLFQFAKFKYECGAYDDTVTYLSFFRDLSNDQELSTQALWGKLAAEIITQNWEDAEKDLTNLKEVIDGRLHTSPTMQLQQRSWLIHWALFIFFSGQDVRASYFEWFNDRYLNVVQMTCPHILRYLAASVIYKRSSVDDLIRIIEQEKYEYNDPVTQFLEALYINVDFEEAEEKIKECEKVYEIDSFLHDIKDILIENSKALLFQLKERVKHQSDFETKLK